jgi:hypothetical protein
VADQDRPTEKKQAQHQAQEALDALRAHRQQSGYVPWNHDDNERLRALYNQQKKRQQDEHALQQGSECFQLRSRQPASSFTAIADVALHVTQAPPPIEAPTNIPDPETQAASLAPDATVKTPKTDVPHPLTIRVDPELARVAVGLDRASEFFVWALARHYFGMPGKTTRSDLLEKVAAIGIITSKRHLNRILKQGRGVFWRLDRHGNVYLVGYVKLAISLTRTARWERPSLVKTNTPGAIDVHIQVGQSLGEFKAQVYLGWLAYRQDPTISRQTLTTLFNCTTITLRNWEKTLGPQLEIVTNYAQTALHPKHHDDIIDYLPDHHYCYVTRRGHIRLRWRLSNTYRTSGVREHAHKGQSRKARTVAAYTAWYQPVECDTPDFQLFMEKLAFDRSHRVPKQYFETPEQLERFLKRMAKQGRRGATPRTPRYIYLGEDRNQHGIFELSLDGHTNTTTNERLRPSAEYAWWKGWQAKVDLARRAAG